MRRRSALVVVLLLAGCAGFGGPRTVLLDERDLARLLAAQFPREQRVLLFDITLALPRVRLLPERNRIGVDLDLAAAERLTGRSVRGALALDHALRYEPSDRTVRLTQVRVERVQFETAAGVALPEPAQRIGGLLAEQALEDLVIWRAPADRDARLRDAGESIGAVTVTSRGVEVTFEPR